MMMMMMMMPASDRVNIPDVVAGREAEALDEDTYIVVSVARVPARLQEREEQVGGRGRGKNAAC